MILIRRRKDGELSAVDSIDGYDMRSWEELGRIPAGVDPSLAVFVDGKIVNNLDVARGARWQQAKARRLEAEAAGCETELGRIQTDDGSQRKLHAFATQAIAEGGAFVPILWTMSDNSRRLHDGAAIVAAHLAVARHGAACHARAQQIRDELAAAGEGLKPAAALAAIAAVDVGQGWPG